MAEPVARTVACIALVASLLLGLAVTVQAMPVLAVAGL
jgi:hypothetical protein